MSKLDFNANTRPTLGVELEFGLIHADTMELASASSEVLAELCDEAPGTFKPELMQCCVEINSGICQSVSDVEVDLGAKIDQLQTVTDKLGLRLWWGATTRATVWACVSVTSTTTAGATCICLTSGRIDCCTTIVGSGS